jgi:GcrA cell cycle regulator
MQSTGWPPAHCEALREYHAKGMSYSAIAEAVNAKFNTAYTRNATLGRAKRMGLAGSALLEDRPDSLPKAATPGIHATTALRKRERQTFKLQRMPVFEAAEATNLRCADVVPRQLSLMDLRSGDCRYPYGGDAEGEAITFCGHPKRPGASYCAAHFDLSIGPGTASERAADTILLAAVLGTVEAE